MLIKSKFYIALSIIISIQFLGVGEVPDAAPVARKAPVREERPKALMKEKRRRNSDSEESDAEQTASQRAPKRGRKLGVEERAVREATISLSRDMKPRFTGACPGGLQVFCKAAVELCLKIFTEVINSEDPMPATLIKDVKDRLFELFQENRIDDGFHGLIRFNSITAVSVLNLDNQRLILDYYAINLAFHCIYAAREVLQSQEGLGAAKVEKIAQMIDHVTRANEDRPETITFHLATGRIINADAKKAQ